MKTSACAPIRDGLYDNTDDICPHRIRDHCLQQRDHVGQDARRATEDSVRAAEFDRRNALLSADTVLLSRLTGSEFYEVNRLGQIRTRAMNMQEIATGALKLQSVAYDSLSVRVYDNVAILTGIADNVGEFRGNPFSGKIRYTRISFDATGVGRQWPCSTLQCHERKMKAPASSAGASLLSVQRSYGTTCPVRSRSDFWSHPILGWSAPAASVRVERRRDLPQRIAPSRAR